MALGLSKTKRRIASIRGTEKITKAMELIATVKLKRVKNAEEALAPYSDEMAALLSELFAHDLRDGEPLWQAQRRQGFGDALSWLLPAISASAAAITALSISMRFAWLNPGDTIAPYQSFRIGRQRFRASHPIAFCFRLLALKDEFNAVFYIPAMCSSTSQLSRIAQASPLFEAIHGVMDLTRTTTPIEARRWITRTTMPTTAQQLTVEYNKARQNAITQEITEVVSAPGIIPVKEEKQMEKRKKKELYGTIVKRWDPSSMSASRTSTCRPS
jgi:hypothetical protein